MSVFCLRLSFDADQIMVNSLGFCAETEMLPRLIRSSESHASCEDGAASSLHLMLKPLFPTDVCGHAILGNDHTISVGNTDLPVVDVNYALAEVEGTRELQVFETRNTSARRSWH